MILWSLYLGFFVWEFSDFVAWILCSLYWEFSICRNWLCGLCGLCIGNFVFWKFSVILLCGFCALCIGNFLFAGIGCVDYVGSELGIFCLQELLREQSDEFLSYIERHGRIRDREIHFQLQSDLIEHLWQLQGES